MSKEWQYSPDWCEEDMLDGSQAMFICFTLQKGQIYIGSKQLWKGRYKKPNN